MPPQKSSARKPGATPRKPAAAGGGSPAAAAAAASPEAAAEAESAAAEEPAAAEEAAAEPPAVAEAAAEPASTEEPAAEAEAESAPAPVAPAADSDDAPASNTAVPLTAFPAPPVAETVPPAPAPEASPATPPPATSAVPPAASVFPAAPSAAPPVPPPPAPDARGGLAPVAPNMMVGMGRAMGAMQVFYACKADYEASLKGLEEGTPAYDAALEAVYLRAAAKALEVARANGGVYNKAAQFVASMQGGGGDKVVPKVFIDTLAILTDRAPFRPLELVDSVLREELGAPSAELFTQFSAEPIAAASLAQVHLAVMRDGRRVAVKVQYPELRLNMASDLSVFRQMGSQIKPGGMDLTWLVDDFEAFLSQEVDFRGEADNTEAAAALLAHRGLEVYVPRVVRELSTPRVLVTHFADGLLRVDDAAGLARAGLHPGDVGALLARTFAEMALCHGRVHGDPHAGNVYVRPLPADALAAGLGKARAGDAVARPLAAAAAKAADAVRANAPPAGLARTAADAVADALASASARLAPPTARPQLVLLDHGLYHTLDDACRTALCRVFLAGARGDAPGMRSASEELARAPGSPLARFFPLSLSHWYVFGVGLWAVTPDELAAARQGRMPPGLTLADLSDFLTGLHGAGGHVLGVVHSLGYTRGLLNRLRFPERRRLRALAAAAARGLAPPPDNIAWPPSGASRLASLKAELSADALAWLLLPGLALVATPYHRVVLPLRAALSADLAALLLFVLVALLAALFGSLSRADHPRLMA